MEQHILITFKSDYIVDFVKKNPVSFYGKGKTERGTPGGNLFPPAPLVGLFLRLIHGTEDLFTQSEYAQYCVKTLNNEHGGWFNGLNKAQQEGFRLRCNRNFYPSMIDALHAWALISEARWFDVCYMDTLSDAVAKTDLTLKRNGKEVYVALIGPKKAAKEHYSYKVNYRQNGNGKVIVPIQMPLREKGPGNKRWYELGDFNEIRPDVDTDYLYQQPVSRYKQGPLFDIEDDIR